jgi:hypothetical protein
MVLGLPEIQQKLPVWSYVAELKACLGGPASRRRRRRLAALHRPATIADVEKAMSLASTETLAGFRTSFAKIDAKITVIEETIETDDDGSGS